MNSKTEMENEARAYALVNEGDTPGDLCHYVDFKAGYRRGIKKAVDICQKEMEYFLENMPGNYRTGAYDGKKDCRDALIEILKEINKP